MADSPTFQIPKEVIEPIIQAHVTTAVVTALGGQGRLIEHAITQVLTQKVDRDGKPSHYSSDVQFLHWALQNAVCNAVKQTLEQEVAKHQDKIRDLLTAQLRQSKSPLVKQLVEGMTKGVIDATTNKWRLSVTYGD